ncbi:T6SS immunity protein Tdi1 domain-containing protein [Enterococcus sp. LJL51]|uniref:T6SS immunity protein Tdi1 domain-containing protein n=1 Tax=Enterococcus sp. LJL51 TaxID=3416656 RepID=UPI003CF8E165
MNQLFDDFIIEQKVNKELIKMYQGRIPEEMLLLWKEYGFGTFLNGFMKSVNPDNFKELLVEGSQRFHDGIVLFATAMGDLIIWEGSFVRILRFRYGKTDTVISGFKFFFEDLSDKDFRAEVLKWSPYLCAIEMHVKPKFDECFGYVPLLGLGGAEHVNNLKVVKLREHLMLITELMGTII